MRAIRRILVAVKDTQAKSPPSLLKAVQLAKAWGADIELFHGLDTPLYIDTAGPTPGGFRGLQREVQTRRVEELEDMAVRVRRHGVKITAAAEWDFPIYEAIVRRATRIGADLIVAECQAGRRFAPVLLRLTDWELLRLSPVPVLLVKNSRPYHHPAMLAAVDPRHIHAKPAQLDDDILKAGLNLQAALHGKLHAVHACAPVLPIVTGDELINAEIAARLQEEGNAEARRSFEHALRGTNIPRARRHLVERHPQDAIADVARSTRSAIVIMGAVSRSGLKRIFIGNTAESLLDELPCDVLVIKPRHFATRVHRAKRGVRLIPPQPIISI